MGGMHPNHFPRLGRNGVANSNLENMDNNFFYMETVLSLGLNCVPETKYLLNTPQVQAAAHSASGKLYYGGVNQPSLQGNECQCAVCLE